MAKNRKKKGRKIRAKTTLPPVKDGKKQQNVKNQRPISIPPANQQNQHRKRVTIKKTVSQSSFTKFNPPIEAAKSQKQLNKTAPNSTALIDAFSNLSLNKEQKAKDDKPIRRKMSTDSRSGGVQNGKTKHFKLEDVAKLITSGKAKNIIVMAGAGISTGSGIPDFRTPGTGLYDNLQKYRIPSPTAIFDLDYFHYDPKPFFALAKEIYPDGKYRPCLPHYFIKLLHDKGLLLRLYTQNIDGLERSAGIPSEKLVEAHGTFSTASCTKCGIKHNALEIKKKILNGIIPRCNSNLCWGIIKPDIVFFGEDLPRRFYYYLKDFPVCDLLIIMGTSLEVEPFASLATSVRFNTPRVLLNRDLVGPFKSKGQKRSFDIGVPGDLAKTINSLSDLVGWKEELNDLMTTSKEYLDEKSETSSSDSGVSSSDRSTESGRKTKHPLPPPNSNIKRYFHSVRTTPPPPKDTKHRFFDAASDISYYNYMKERTYLKAPSATRYNDKNTPPGLRGSPENSTLAIQYAQTVPGKKCAKSVSCTNTKQFSMRLQKPRHIKDPSSSDSLSDSQTGTSDSDYQTSLEGST